MSYKDKRSSAVLRLSVIFGFFLWGVAGCKPVETPESPPSTFERLLTPYLTATSSPVPNLGTAPQASTPNPTEIPLPTPTPEIYTVAADDTLTGIAFRYSVPLEDLIAANPGLDPNFLTIGLTLTIPLDGVIAQTLPTPTPIPLELQSPVCYSLTDGSIQCLAVVENYQAYDVENVVVQIFLQSADGKFSEAKTGIPPLNIIPAGRKAAASVTFEAFSSLEFSAMASLLTVIPVAQDTRRYLPTDLQIQDSLISSDGLQAQVGGSVKLLEEQLSANTIWVAAFAYDENENIVGFRKWVSNDVLVSGDLIDFSLIVYSFGPAISHLELIAEARP